LEKVDFELRTKKILQKYDLVLRHGGFYFDPTEGVERQFDFRAFSQKPGYSVVPPVRIELTLECKHLAENSGLLVSRVPRERHEAFHHVVSNFAISQSSDPDLSVSQKVVKEVVKSHGYYRKGEPVGKEINHLIRTEPNPGKKSLRNLSEFIIKGGDKDIHPRWTQALSSMFELLVKTLQQDTTEGREPGHVMFLPILVVPDGRLWHVDYDGKGEIFAGPSRCDEVDMYVERAHSNPHQQNSKIVLTHLKILTLSGLDEFLQLVDGSKDYLGGKTFAEICFAEASNNAARNR
jgi:hypothetical protein